MIHSQIRHQAFDPVIAHIQLTQFLNHNKIVSDEEAGQLREQAREQLGLTDADQFFREFLDVLSRFMVFGS